MANFKEIELTPTQKEVLNLMWETTTTAPVGRRQDLGNGRYQLYKAERPTRPVDFPASGFEQEEFALKLHERKIDATLSPYYVNLRNMPDNLLTRVAEAIAEAAHISTSVCTGIPSAGDPIAQRFSEITGIPRLHLFGKAEEVSGRKIVAAQEAPLAITSRRSLLILDDLITEADTKFEAAEVAKNLGYDVVGIAVLVDRQQGGKESLETQGFRVSAPLPISEVFAYYYATGKIDYSRYLKSMDYLNDSRLKADLSKIKLLPQ